MAVFKILHTSQHQWLLTTVVIFFFFSFLLSFSFDIDLVSLLLVSVSVYCLKMASCHWFHFYF